MRESEIVNFIFAVELLWFFECCVFRLRIVAPVDGVTQYCP